MRTGSAAIHAAAVTAAAWITALTTVRAVARGRDSPARSCPTSPEVITHGFPVGELAASSSPTGKPWVITRGNRRTRPHCGLVRRTQAGSYRFETCRMRTGSAAIHAAAVTAAAWIWRYHHVSGSCARARLARAQLPDITTK